MAGSDRGPGETEAVSQEGTSTADAANGAPMGASLDDGAQNPPRDVHLYIGAQLRAAFDDVANQPVPDRFLELMRKLG